MKKTIELNCNFLNKIQLTEEQIKTAINLIIDLSEWSLKYPRTKYYPSSLQQQMDGELIKIEEEAKIFINNIKSAN